MGVVYLAEQTEPLKRQVALKVIKHGMDTHAVARRFEIERQTLALMNHPAIARVFEAGETSSGRPFFAMEYIEGEPITDYCDRRMLATVDRLELFTRVCEGLQHAHQRGIIHRDVKPSIVLVAEHDGKPVPKIIDFGVAKAIEQDLGVQSELTALGVLLGTPEYMSPEQADLSPLEVDTRTDVYSLGVLLYELLTGALPFDARRLRRAAFDEIRRQIREVRPSKPSARLSELGRQADGLASSRRTDVSALSRRLSGDLDLITTKALEKDRGLRYGSPAEFAADIRRHLDNEPVLTQPPSAIYQLRKLVSRHRLVSTLLVLFVVTLLGFSVWMSVLYRRALAAEQAAEREAAGARQVSDFVTRVFEISDPDEARGNSATARELLDNAAERIDDELGDQPEIQATMQDTMGRVYSSLGLYDRAAELSRDALAQREALFDENDPAVADSLTNLATTLMRQGKFDEGEKLARRAISIFEADNDGDPLAVVAPLEVLQLIHWQRREHDEALGIAQRVLEVRKPVIGDEHYDISQSLNNLGNIYLAMGKNDEAETVIQRALELRVKAVGPDHPGVGVVTNNLAELYRRQGRYDEAETLFLRVQENDAKNYEPNHPQNAFAFNNLGMVYKRWKRYDEAIEQYRRALEIREAALPPDLPIVAWTLDNLGLAYLAKGDLDGAEEAFLRALEIAERSVGPDNPDTGIVIGNLALLRTDQKRFDEAERLLRRTLEINRNTFGEEHRETGNTQHNLGQLYEDWGQKDKAAEHYRQALEILEVTIGPDHPDTIDTREHYEAVKE
jgi:serine/threonine protein kinase/Tfp pilus assembly protein PilF